MEWHRRSGLGPSRGSGGFLQAGRIVPGIPGADCASWVRGFERGSIMNRMAFESAVAGAALSISCAAAPGQNGPNLVYNGSFELGNVGITTNYGYFPCTGSCNVSPGLYTLTSNPSTWNPGLPPCADHTHLSGP